MCAFQFVNKTSSSDLLSRSERAEKFLIQSHVQSRRRKRQKQLLLVNGVDSNDSSSDESWSKHVSVFQRQESPLTSANAISKGLPRKGSGPQTTHTNSHTSINKSHIHSLSGAFNLSNYNSVGIDASSHAMLHYVFSYAARDTFLAEAFAPSSAAKKILTFRHDRMITQRLQRCGEDKMLMYCTLAYGSSYQAWTTGRIEHDRPPEYFLGKAIEAVRLHLASTGLVVDSWLLLSMYALTITELWAGIPEMWLNVPSRYHNRTKQTSEAAVAAAEMHLTVLKSLIKLHGGMKTLGPYLMESLILADKFLALYRMSCPILPLSWDPGRMSAKRRKFFGVEEDDHPFSFGKNFVDVSIGEQLLHIICDVVDYAHVARSAWNKNDVEASNESWLFLRLQALFYRLLLLNPSSNLEDCVRITVMLCLLSVTRYQGSQLSAISLLRHLRTAVDTLQRSAIPVTGGLMFWFVCTGAMTAAQGEQSAWFLSRAIYVANTLAIETNVGGWEQQLEFHLFMQEQRLQLEAMMSRV